MNTVKAMANNISNPIRSRIGKRIILIMVLISGTVTLTATTLQLVWDYKREVSDVENRHKEIETIHVPLLAASLWEFDLKLLQQKLEGLINLPRINYLEVRSASELFYAGSPVKDNALTDEYLIVYQSSYNEEPEILGTLRVESDQQEIYDYLIRQFVITLIINAFKTIIVCLVILMVIHISINRRIFSIAQYLRRYNPRHPSKPLKLPSTKVVTQHNDELNQLGNETNKITSRLTLLYNNIKYEQERFSDFANVASDWLWETDENDILIYASSEMIDALDINENIQLHFRDLPALKNAEQLLDKIAQKQSFSFCQETVVIDGITHYLLFQANANYKDGEFTNFRGTAIDITVLQQAQIELEELNNTLEGKVIERTQDLETSMHRLQKTQQQLIESEKLAALGGLVSGVAHEVNTPLGISVTAASIIKEIIAELNNAFAQQTLTTSQFSNLMERMNESTDMLETNLNRGAKLIRDFKQTAVDQVSESRSIFKVYQVLDSLIASLHPETRKIPVEPRLVGDTNISMNSLPGVLTQVISNLVLNSVNHAFTNQTAPEIVINFTEEGDKVVFEYRDNGSGIEKHLHQKIFEPFFTSKRGKGGSGLGLNLVFNLIQHKLEGHLEFDSEPGQGVHFKFWLPSQLPLTVEKELEELEDVSGQQHG
ncbi:histidine kinase [Vibrio sp. MACH09]|uniref:sensor histidine kinase n=1 Tax=unclassified Vibrio TaxID=2614977 RepID=UPI0014937A2F|nr:MULTISPECIES: ATP-binding protein [unclassified Vibrio]NOI67886.1 ATP-binding protein [Vibrio sp. 99-8-1]GLO62789.1 histidine kinase [Vibrio sp. MACH09]